MLSIKRSPWKSSVACCKNNTRILSMKILLRSEKACFPVYLDEIVIDNILYKCCIKHSTFAYNDKINI